MVFGGYLRICVVALRSCFLKLNAKRPGFGFSGAWIVNDRNDLRAPSSDFKRLTKHEDQCGPGLNPSRKLSCDKPFAAPSAGLPKGQF